MTFEKWLQERLIAHGSSIKPDGDWGRESIRALEVFQKNQGLPVSGVADNATILALRRSPSDAGSPKSTSTPVAVERMPPWMAEMHRRMGLDEIKDNASLIEFLKIGRYLGNPKNLPWCGDAIESVIAKTLPKEVLPSNPFFAQAWKSFGKDVGEPIIGSIGVIRWTPSSGHVGIVAGISGGNVILLGGNQSNAINLSSFKRKKFIAFRWPTTYPVRQYPALKGTAVGVGDLLGTR